MRALALILASGLVAIGAPAQATTWYLGAWCERSVCIPYKCDAPDKNSPAGLYKAFEALGGHPSIDERDGQVRLATSPVDVFIYFRSQEACKAFIDTEAKAASEAKAAREKTLDPYK